MINLRRFLSGLVFALPLALITFALVRAEGAPQPATTGQAQQDELQCQDCHAEFQQAWANGAHGKALSDVVFQEQWTAQGKPKECLSCHTTGYNAETGTYVAEGVTCLACHNPISAGHPLAPATMTRAANKCGECHKDTFFEWQSSKHGLSDLTCVNCHDAHSTSLKAADASTLCASCHGTRVAAFAHSAHAAKGLTCVDCHISATGKTMGMGQNKNTHSFAVDMTLCVDCHATDVHNPTKAMLVSGEGIEVTPPASDSGSSGYPLTVSTTPEAVSPVGYALFAGLIGLAFGIVLAPWLERGLHLFTKHQTKIDEVKS